MQTILDGLTWLGLDWDNKNDPANNGNHYSQFEHRERHAEIARQMVANGTAYYCYASPQELDEMRAEQKAKGLPQRYDGRWRDRPASDAPKDVKPVIRLKAPQTGDTTVNRSGDGQLTVKNEQLDDMVLLRADGTPTYMLAVVVDDHDMNITHVVRGDDHLTNTFRQVQIFKAMGWKIPAIRAYADDPGTGWREIVEAPRSTCGQRLPGARLSAGSDPKLSFAPVLGAWRR